MAEIINQKAPVIFFDVKKDLSHFWNVNQNYFGAIETKTKFKKSKTEPIYNFENNSELGYPCVIIKGVPSEDQYCFVPLINPMQGILPYYLITQPGFDDAIEKHTIQHQEFLNYLDLSDEVFTTEYNQHLLVYEPKAQFSQEFFDMFKKYWEEISLIAIKKVKSMQEHVEKAYQEIQERNLTTKDKKDLDAMYQQSHAFLASLCSDPYQILENNGFTYTKKELLNLYQIENRKDLLSLNIPTKKTFITNTEGAFSQEYLTKLNQEHEFLGKYWRDDVGFFAYSQQQMLQTFIEQFKLCGKHRSR